MLKGLYPKLAASNIKSNAKTYVPYLIACIVTIMMFYIMGMLARDEGLLSIPAAYSLISMLRFGTFVIGVLSVIFLFYINSFLIKRRKKEFGLLNVLGMEKRHIARILFFETLYIALLSLILGLLAGIVCSKLLQLLLLKLLSFEVQMGIRVSLPSVRDTLCLFAIIFALSFLNNLRQIHLSSPTELLRGGQVGEREPKTKWLMTLVGVVSLAVAYYIALTTQRPLDALMHFFLAVLLVILGTYCLFTSGSIALLKLLRRNKRYYYQTKHFISVSGMLYRMKQHAAGLSTICIMSTCVIIMLSTTLSLYVGLEDALRYRYPRNIYLQTDPLSQEQCAQIERITQETLEEYGVEPERERAYRYLFLPTQQQDGVFQTASDYNSMTDTTTIIPLEDYNRMEGQTQTLASGELLLCDSSGFFAADSISLNGISYQVKAQVTAEIMEEQAVSIFGGSNYLLVLPDVQSVSEAFRAMAGEVADGELSYHYGFDTTADSQLQLDAAQALRSRLVQVNGSVSVTSVEGARADFLANYGGLLFLGIFLGALFLMCAVLIIYYKQISEGYDDKSRFEIMQKVGLSRSEVRKTIQSQAMTMFFLPLLAAAVHVAMAFHIITKLLTLLNLTNVPLFALCTLGTILAFMLFYALVYALTARVYYKIVQ